MKSSVQFDGLEAYMRVLLVLTGFFLLAGCAVSEPDPEPARYPDTYTQYPDTYTRYPASPEPATYYPPGTTTYTQVTTVDYWHDDGGAWYYGDYYPGAVFVPGTWDEYYFPSNGCYVPGGVLLGADRPHANRQLQYRAYRGHSGKAKTGYAEMRDEPRRHRKDSPGHLDYRDGRYRGDERTSAPYGDRGDDWRVQRTRDEEERAAAVERDRRSRETSDWQARQETERLARAEDDRLRREEAEWQVRESERLAREAEAQRWRDSHR
jgi:hypothetical protein